MKKLDEESALAIVFANTRRKKRTADLITVAKSFEYLVKLYRSRKAVAEKVGLSTEMVREFLKVLSLPDQVKKMVSSREIDGLDVALEISMLEDAEKQIAAAKTIAGLPSKDVRDIRRLAEHADLPIEESKRMVLESKPKGLHIFVMDFDDETYDALNA
ncbi:MAG: hypothetical protein MUP04_04055, partial [Anaerolineae bacterium]|nr:hypothetical protein [Anaerolineae bacterium]